MIESLQKQLSKAFKADQHEWNGKGHIYVNVNSTIERLNSLVDIDGWPVPWSFGNKHFSTAISPTRTKPTPAFPDGKAQYDAFCVGELTIGALGTRMGTGADTNVDLDTASKSSQAYSLRKGANYFGVAMYLLTNPQQESDLVKYLNSSDVDDSEAMKAAVLMVMEIRKIEVSAVNLCNEFNIDIERFKTDGEVWKDILVQENRI